MAERPLIEKVEELRQEIYLKEGDRKAYYENCYFAQKKNKERIAELRKENKELRKQLKDRLSADDHIISQAFQDRPVERAALANKSSRDAITIMDHKTCDTKKKLNALKHATALKQKKLDELKLQNEAMEKDANEAKATEAGESAEGQRLRELENKMHKTDMKLNEAEHIKRTYEQIRASFQEEHLTFGNTLDAMEKEIKQTRQEIEELQETEEEAKRCKESAIAKLRSTEEMVYTERKRREAEIQKLKAEAEEKRLHYEKIEKRLALRESQQETSLDRPASSIGDNQQERITDLQEAFLRIKEATGVSDLREVVIRFEDQGSTREHLQKLKDDNESKIRRLRDERDSLQVQYDEVKYSGECKLSSGQRLLENYQNHLHREQTERQRIEEELEVTSKTLVQCKAGVQHLHEKLAHIKVPRSGQVGGLDPSSDTYVIDVLGRCEEKVVKLMEELEKENIEEALEAMRSEEFNAQVETKLPQQNLRIKLASAAKDNVYDDESDSGDDDGEVMSRLAVKKQSQQLIEQKTKKRAVRKKKKK